MLNLDETEVPEYVIEMGGKQYSFEPFALAISLEKSNVLGGAKNKELALIHAGLTQALKDSCNGDDLPDLSLIQAVIVLKDYTEYMVEVKEKMLPLLGAPQSTDTDSAEIWRKIKASEKEHTDSGSTSIKIESEPTEASTTTEPSKPPTILA